MFTATKDKPLVTTTTGALPRPSWYTENLRGMPLSQGFSQSAYREQHFDCLACHVATQHRAGSTSWLTATHGSMTTSPGGAG
jgi:5-methyltetrahydropteroyltriglutamate--homocysteine methyltransferase